MNKLEVLAKRVYQCEKPNLNGTQIITYGYLVTSKDETHPTRMQMFEQGKRIGYVCGYIQDIIADGVDMYHTRLSSAQLSTLEKHHPIECSTADELEALIDAADTIFESIGLEVK